MRNDFFIIVGISILLLFSMGLSGCIEKTVNEDKAYESHSDYDNDGYYDDNDDFPYDATEWRDTDNDGYGDNSDAFPYDASEWRDSDYDGYGDNVDAFPYDSTEWSDTDGDGYGDNSDVFPHDSSEWKDSDHDNRGDNSDVFPFDSSEWEDSDGDGKGDNSDPYPYDYDNDGYDDDVDIMKNGDAAIKISLDQFYVVDQLDFLFTSVEVFFEIYIDGRMEARIDNNGVSWDATVGQLYVINDGIIFNIDDDQRYTDVRIVMWDDDYIPGIHDAIDIDGHDDSKGLSVVFDAITETWSGDDNDGYADGREDGSWDYDDDDGILWYDIEISEVEYDKTYSWYYSWRQWTLHVKIPPERYAYYRHSGVDRSPYPYSEGAHFVTSDDPVVVEIANKLSSLATENDYDYYGTVNFVLRFVQSLKYSYDNESVGPNDYWRFPVETLVDELGDCEDTSLLFASIMEAMGYDTVLLLPPAHMAVGMWGNEGYLGSYYNYEGKRYYFCETTGDWWTMGLIPPNYLGVSATIVQVE